MPITAAEIRATTFATTRMRSGYDMDEVDSFLDILEADVAQYADELQRSRDGEAVLRTQCDQLQARVTNAENRLVEAQSQTTVIPAAVVAEPAPDPRPAAPSPAPADEAAIPTIATEELLVLLQGHPEAADVLELAQRTADEIVRQAEVRAASIRAAVAATLDEQRRLIEL